MAGVGVPLERSSSEATDAALAFAEACLEVAEVVKQRAVGGFDSTPNPRPRPALTAPEPVAADGAPLLSVVKAWEHFRPRPSETRVDTEIAALSAQSLALRQ